MIDYIILILDHPKMIELKLRKQNREIIKQYKTKCAICGESEPCCLEFHHIKTKRFGISQGVTTKEPKELIQELKSCICVCKNCHTKIHNNIIKKESI